MVRIHSPRPIICTNPLRPSGFRGFFLVHHGGLMGTRGREIVGMDVDRLIDMLNRAYASEWLAYYQVLARRAGPQGPDEGLGGRGAQSPRDRGAESRRAAGRPHRAAGRHAAARSEGLVPVQPLRVCGAGRSARRDDSRAEHRRGAVRHHGLQGADGRDEGQGHGHLHPCADHPAAGGGARGGPAEPPGRPEHHAASGRARARRARGGRGRRRCTWTNCNPASRGR